MISSENISSGKTLEETEPDLLRSCKETAVKIAEEYTAVFDKEILSEDEAHITMIGGNTAIVPLISVYEGIERENKRGKCKNIFHISEYGLSADELWGKSKSSRLSTRPMARSGETLTHLAPILAGNDFSFAKQTKPEDLPLPLKAAEVRARRKAQRGSAGLPKPWFYRASRHYRQNYRHSKNSEILLLKHSKNLFLKNPTKT